MSGRQETSVRSAARVWARVGLTHPVDDAAAVLRAALAQVADLREALAANGEDGSIQPETAAALEEKLLWLRLKLLRLSTLVAEAAHCAYHDELTALPNRALLIDRLRQAMAHAARQGRMLAVILLDLNGFKAINDRLGHNAGDKLLIHVARMLNGSVRESDTVCRYGGDEFVIMIPEIADAAAVAAVMEKIRDRLATPLALDGQLVQVSASMGVALYPADGEDLEQLIQRADVAMYRAKGIAAADVEH
jgi:diguanylate cyclase (GGDEF)-like protein